MPELGVSGQFGVTSVLVMEVMTIVCPAPETMTLNVPTPEGLAVTLTGVWATLDLVYATVEVLLGTIPLSEITDIVLAHASEAVTEDRVTALTVTVVEADATSWQVPLCTTALNWVVWLRAPEV